MKGVPREGSNQGNDVFRSFDSKDYIKNVQRSGLAKLKAIARVSILSL